MDRQHRHDLKHDRFVDEVGALTQKAQQNQRLLYAIAAGVLAIAVIGYGIYFYLGSREEKGQRLLAEAIRTAESPVGTEAPPAGQPAPKFKTAEERDAAAEKQFKEVHESFGGSDAGDVASLYLARMAAGRGDVAGARKLLEDFIASQGEHVLAGSARYSLFQLRIQSGDAAQVVTELSAELGKADPVLPADSILALLASAYEKQGNDAKSLESYQRIVTEFPESPYAGEARRRTGAA